MKLLICIAVLSLLAQSSLSLPVEQQLENDPRIIQLTKDIINGLIVAPVNHVAKETAALLAQLSMGVIDNGLIGKREAADPRIKDALIDLHQTVVSALKDKFETTLQSVAMGITEALANFGNSRAQSPRIKDALIDLHQTIVDAIKDQAVSLHENLKDQVENSIKDIAMGITEALANFGNSRAQGPSPRIKDALIDLHQTVVAALKDKFETTLQSVAMGITEALANFGNSRSQGPIADARIKDFLNALFDGLKPHIDNIVKDAAMSITEALADFASSRVIVSGGEERIIGTIISMKDKIKDTIIDKVNEHAMNLAPGITAWLADVAENGLLPQIGK